MRETPKILITTSYEKLCEGTRLIVEPNSKNIKNTWAIRREVPTILLNYGKPSTTRRRWVYQETLFIHGFCQETLFVHGFYQDRHKV